ncbi:MAG: RDD family protein [Actinobacteria bacterium]|nr:MAG: RDD family protein [Actinomycetota bacterium]
MTEPSYQQPAYQPPAGTGPSGPRASFGRRLVAAIIDGILLGVVGGIFYAISRPLGYAVQLLITIAYLTYLEGSPSGQTVGKKAMGIRVIDFRTGGSIGYGRAFVRWIGRYVSAIPCLLGYLWMLWDKEKQTWHDKFANDVVVPESAYPVESWPG